MSGTRAGALRGWETRRKHNPPESSEVIQAYKDWLTGRAYLDNGGNYRLKNVDAQGYFIGGSRGAPWNRAVKARFGKDQRRSGNERFHDAAHRYAKAHRWNIERFKHYGRSHRTTNITERGMAYQKSQH